MWNKFSLSAPSEMYREQYGEYVYWSLYVKAYYSFLAPFSWKIKWFLFKHVLLHKKQCQLVCVRVLVTRGEKKAFAVSSCLASYASFNTCLCWPETGQVTNINNITTTKELTSDKHSILNKVNLLLLNKYCPSQNFKINIMVIWLSEVQFNL